MGWTSLSGLVRGKVQDQNTLAAMDLARFNRAIPIHVISRSQDWRTRQRIDYEASLGFLKQDFLGLKDWKEQIGLFSRASMALRIAYRIIRPLLTRNRHVLLKMMRHPRMGWVGRWLLRMTGMDRVFTVPHTILEKKDGLRSSLKGF